MSDSFAGKTTLPFSSPPLTTSQKNEDLLQRRAEAAEPVGAGPLNKVRAAGRLTARERLDYLLDEGSFVETDQFARHRTCLLYTSPSPRDRTRSRMPSSA